MNSINAQLREAVSEHAAICDMPSGCATAASGRVRRQHGFAEANGVSHIPQASSPLVSDEAILTRPDSRVVDDQFGSGSGGRVHRRLSAGRWIERLADRRYW